MEHEKDEKPLNPDLIDKWLENFFLDPLTSYQDEAIFRIDLFETAEEFIIEALLDDYNAKDVKVHLVDDKVYIRATHSINGKEPKQRVITFPFSIINHVVSAHFESGILEIYIPKRLVCYGKNRAVKIN